MSFAKPLALVAILSLGLVACGNKEEAADVTAETGAAVDTGAMSSTAPTTVNPADTTSMGGTAAPTDPAAASSTGAMSGSMSGATVPTTEPAAGGANVSPPNQGPVTPPK